MTYTCDEARLAIPWLLDDELDPVQSIELEAHVATCAECRAMMEREGRLRQTLRRALDGVQAPTRLRRLVRDSITSERRRQTWLGKAWPAAAAASILLALIWKGGSPSWFPELDEATQRHARDLPMDIKANAADATQVQRYFHDKLPFAVSVPQLSGRSVSEVGGRVTHLRDRETAYVRYEMPTARVSVFVYEDADHDPFEVVPLYHLGAQHVYVKRIHGYTVARWRASGLVYSVVTDLPESEIPTLVPVGLR